MKQARVLLVGEHRDVAFAGDPDDLIRQIEAAAAGGATRVDLGTPHGLDEAEAIRLIGERVLPHFAD